MVNIIEVVNKIVWGLPLILILIITHIYLTIKLKFPQKNTFLGLKLMLKPNKESGISSFNSLMTVLAATIGTGNIIGVASAITIGGIGSIFWIFVSSIFAIATKYSETYLCLKYRKIKKDKNCSYTKYYGGAMYVLKDRIGSRILGYIFSIFVIIASFGIGCMIQSNSAANTISQNFNIDINIIGILITIVGIYFVLAREKKIAKISSIIVPIATIVYLIMSAVLLYIFKDNIIYSIKEIIASALNLRAGITGIFAYSFIIALSTGLSKGMFSNEAGMGSSPIFEVTVNNKDIKNQSIISSTSVFIDTTILCTLTGIIFVASNFYLNETNPLTLVQNVFNVLPYGKYLLSFCLTSFALATIPCWAYYGKQGVKYIFKDKKIYEILYNIVYIVCIYIGAVTTLQVIWDISSIANAFMVIPNLFMIYYLIDEIKC